MKHFNLLFFLVVSFLANAQTISGKIISKDDGQPVPYAKIGVEGEAHGTVADEKGNYILDLNGFSRDKYVKRSKLAVMTFLNRKLTILLRKIRT